MTDHTSATRAETRNATQISAAELQQLDEFKNLVSRVQQIGVLSYSEIKSATADASLDDGDLEASHDRIERCEVELVDEIPPATAATLNIERAPERPARRGRAQLNRKPDATTDAPQLKTIGQVRLLRATQEIDLTKRASNAATWPRSR